MRGELNEPAKRCSRLTPSASSYGRTRKSSPVAALPSVASASVLDRMSPSGGVMQTVSRPSSEVTRCGRMDTRWSMASSRRTPLQ